MLAYLSCLLSTRLRADRGATAVEYGLMVALIAVAIIGAVFAFGESLSAMFTEVGETVGGVETA